VHYDVAISELSKLANRLFPTVGAIDEELQIGRAAVIAELADRFTSGSDTLMIEPRQVGKTSVLRAALQAACRSDDIVVAQADLHADAIDNSAQLGATLVETAAEHGLSSGLLAKRLKKQVSKVGDALGPPAETVAAIADALGVPAEVTSVVKAVERALVAAAHRPHRGLRFVFAGSRRRALERLFARDRPLHVLSDRYELPRIDPGDWINGLTKRLREGGLGCDREVLLYLLEESNGHPLATMYAAKEMFLVARVAPAGEAEHVHVDDALSRARGQLWWEEFTKA
jgi:hypothetical protein